MTLCYGHWHTGPGECGSCAKIEARERRMIALEAVAEAAREFIREECVNGVRWPKGEAALAELDKAKP